MLVIRLISGTISASETTRWFSLTTGAPLLGVIPLASAAMIGEVKGLELYAGLALFGETTRSATG